MERHGGTGRGRRRRGAAVLCGLLATLACGGARDAYDRVVVVAVSSLRWDHLSGNGYPRPTTPSLDRLAAGGARFDRAYAGSARRSLALATLLTGLEPVGHGLRDPDGRLPPAVPTLAERLAGRGYRTAAFVSHHRSFEPRGLDRGFAHVDAPPELAETPYRAADRTVDAALAWLEQQGGGNPLLLLLQLEDPSRPYRAPPRYLPLAVGAERGPSYYAFLEREHGVPLGWYRWEHVRLNAVFNGYDAELRFVDTELSRFREGLAVLDLLDRTLFVVTGLHGTGLGNHFWDGAGEVLYEEQVRVPLMIAAGDGSVARRRIPDVVSHADVVPTVLALLDPGAPPGAPPELGGRSLLPLLAGGTLAPRPAFFDRGTPRPLGRAQRRQLERAPIRPPPGMLLGAVQGRWKLLDADGPRDALYDLERDPRERRNLLAEDAPLPAELRPLREALAERRARAKRGQASRPPDP